MRVAFPRRTLDLGFHAFGDPLPEHHISAHLEEDRVPEEQAQLTLFRIAIVQKLRKSRCGAMGMYPDSTANRL